jgi:hypothetical protein
MAHSLRVQSKANKENRSSFRFSGGCKPGKDFAGQDRIHDDGKGADLRTVAGVDELIYWGEQESIEATDPEDLLLSVNGGPWHPAEDYGATKMGGSGGDSGSSSGGGSGGDSGGGGGGGTSKDASGSFDGDTGTSDEDYEADPQHGVVVRPLETRRDNPRSIGSGGDCGTVQGGVNTWPRWVEHVADLELQKGVHGSEPGDSVNIPPTNVASAHGSAFIVGDGDNPEDYVIDAKQLNFQLNAGSAQNGGLEGVTVRGTVQARRGSMEIDGCIIETGERWNKGDNVPVDTYKGHVQILDGTVIKGEGAAFNLVEGATISVGSNCVIDVDGPLATSGQGGGEISISGDVDISCASLTPDNWDQSIVTIKDPHGATDGIDEGSRADVRR